MLTGGYVKFFRSLVNWEWYEDINVKTLFIHLLLTVNYEPRQWQGIMIEKGQRITSLEKLSTETNLSIRQTRTAIEKLKSTGEITIKATNKFTLINVENYSKFQTQETESDKRMTNERQTDDKRTTTMEESKKNINKNINKIHSEIEKYSELEELRQALKDFLEMRKKAKAPMTDRAFNLLLGNLDKLAVSEDLKIKILEQSILNNWKSVYPLKQDKQTAKTNKPNKFHNFEGKIGKLAETELEEIMRKKREKFGKS